MTIPDAEQVLTGSKLAEIQACIGFQAAEIKSSLGNYLRWSCVFATISLKPAAFPICVPLSGPKCVTVVLGDASRKALAAVDDVPG